MLKEVRIGSPARTGAAVRLDSIENIGTEPGPRADISASSLFMSDSIEGLNVGPLPRSLVAGQRARVDAASRRMVVKRGGTVFTQGEHHDGTFIVKTRRFICGPRTASPTPVPRSCPHPATRRTRPAMRSSEIEQKRSQKGSQYGENRETSSNL